MKNACGEWEEAAGAALSGDAAPAERTAWEAHLVSCAKCRTAHARDIETIALWRAARPNSDSAPMNLADDILARIDFSRGRVVAFPLRRTVRWIVPVAGVAAAATLALLLRPAGDAGPVPAAHRASVSAAPVTTLARLAPVASFVLPPAAPQTTHATPVSSASASARARAIRGDANLRGISAALLAEAYAEAGSEEVFLAEQALGEAILEADSLDTGDLLDGLSPEATEYFLEELKVEV